LLRSKRVKDVRRFEGNRRVKVHLNIIQIETRIHNYIQTQLKKYKIQKVFLVN